MAFKVYLHRPGTKDDEGNPSKWVLYINDSQDEEFISNGKLKLEINKAGSFEFDILPVHSCYKMLMRYLDYVSVEEYEDDGDDGTILFYGRIMSISMDFSGLKHVTCEGLLANLMDCPMYDPDLYKLPEWPDIEIKDSERIYKIRKSSHTMFDTLTGAITCYRNLVRQDIVHDEGWYNKKDTHVEPFTNTWIDSEISVSGQSVGDFILNTLVANIGGFLCMEYKRANTDSVLTYHDKYGGGSIYGNLRWLPDPTMSSYVKKENIQTIEFGVNLLDLSAEYDNDDITTAIGVSWSNQDEDENNSEDKVQDNSTQYLFTHMTDVDYPTYDRIVPVLFGMTGNYLTNVKTKHFDVTSQDAAMEIAQSYVNRYCTPDLIIGGFDSISIRAIDMHYFGDDDSVKKIELYDMVRIISEPHGIDQEMLCSSVEIDIDNQSNNSYKFNVFRPVEPSDEKLLSRRLGRR